MTSRFFEPLLLTHYDNHLDNVKYLAARDWICHVLQYRSL